MCVRRSQDPGRYCSEGDLSKGAQTNFALEMVVETVQMEKKNLQKKSRVLTKVLQTLEKKDASVAIIEAIEQWCINIGASGATAAVTASEFMSENGVEELAAESEAAEAEKVPGIFGVDVDLHAGVLRHVQTALDWLSTNHLATEGLWRVSGSQQEVKRLEALADKVGAFPLDEIQNSANMTSLLVHLLQQLPGGLIDAETTRDLLGCFSNPNQTAAHLSLMEVIKIRMSVNKYELLHLFLGHWRQVISTTENTLSAHDISTCVYVIVFPCVTDLKLIALLENLLETDTN